MASFKSANPGCCCGPPCTLCVGGQGPCGLIPEASVTIYGNTTTVDGSPVPNGADLDPANNTVTYGTGTVDSITGEYCLTMPPGVYMIETVAEGYDTDHRFAYVCTSCSTLFPKFAVGQTVDIASDGGGATLTASNSPYVPIADDLSSGASAGLATYPLAGLAPTAHGPYGTGPYSCDPATGVVVSFLVGCGGMGVEVYYFVPVIACSLVPHTYTIFLDFHVFGGIVPFPFYSGYVRVTGTVDHIELSPLKITGTWATDYSQYEIFGPDFSTSSHTANGDGDPRGVTVPFDAGGTYTLDAPAPPLSGPFTIT